MRGEKRTKQGKEQVLLGFVWFGWLHPFSEPVRLYPFFLKYFSFLVYVCACVLLVFIGCVFMCVFEFACVCVTVCMSLSVFFFVSVCKFVSRIRS